MEGEESGGMSAFLVFNTKANRFQAKLLVCSLSDVETPKMGK